MYPQFMFLGKIRKNIEYLHLKIIIFTAVKIAAYACLRNGDSRRYLDSDTHALISLRGMLFAWVLIRLLECIGGSVLSLFFVKLVHV